MGNAFTCRSSAMVEGSDLDTRTGFSDLLRVSSGLRRICRAYPATCTTSQIQGNDTFTAGKGQGAVAGHEQCAAACHQRPTAPSTHRHAMQFVGPSGRTSAMWTELPPLFRRQECNAFPHPKVGRLLRTIMVLQSGCAQSACATAIRISPAQVSRRSGITQAAPGSPWQSADRTGTSIRADNASQGGGIELVFWGRFLPSHWGWALATTPLHRHAQTRVNTHHATLGTEGRPFQMRGTQRWHV